MSVFHSYDIRGIYQKEIDTEFAYKLGVAYAQHFSPASIVVGHDARNGKEALTQELIEGLMDMGVKVFHIGLCTTPEFYFAINYLKAQAGIMVTASHNPKEYTGFKCCVEKAIPIGYENGLNKIETLMQNLNLPVSGREVGYVEQTPIHEAYIDFLLKRAKDIRGTKVVFDTGNGVVGAVLPALIENIDVDPIFLNLDVDGTFPSHSPNPLEKGALDQARDAVLSQKADIAVIYDGDGDRVFFLDEKGSMISPNAVMLLIVQAMDDPKRVIQDLRMSRYIREWCKSKGIIVTNSRVGHSHIKRAMRDQDVDFAGELSGHYYFKEAFFTDNALLTTLYMLHLVSIRQLPVSQLVEDVSAFFSSGEMNYKVSDKDVVFKKIEEKYATAKIEKLDGISVYQEDAFFNVRASNTEPLIRVNIEAQSEQKLEELKKTLVDLVTEDLN